MFAPLIYISTWKIKEGRLEDFEQFTRKIVKLIQEKEPQLIAFNVFLNEEQTEMTSIQIHPDADSMDFHMQVVNDILGEEMNDWVERADFIEPLSFEICGAPSTALLEADQPAVEAGIPRRIKPLRVAGFIRSSASR
ncbi:MAG: hypothetical protein R3335_08345 [Anaerolineales bacterium]|nr:hypothetical protein [Anaerolineales bacterium]